MGEFTPTAANVVVTGGTIRRLTAGEAITAGQLVYQKAADSKAWLAQSDGTAEEATIAGIAINNAAAGQPVNYVAEGDVTMQSGIFTTPGTGQILVLGPTAGKFQLASDLDAANDDYVSIVGMSISANAMRLAINNTGLQRPAA